MNHPSFNAGMYISTITQNYVRYFKYSYSVPCEVVNKANKLRCYFKHLGDAYNYVSPVYAIRRGEIDFWDFLILKFSRLEKAISCGSPVVLGSSHYCPTAWMTFNQKRMSRCGISNFDELIQGYGNTSTDDYSCMYVEFGECTKSQDILSKLCKKYRIGIVNLLSVMVLFLYDVVNNTGPDCPDVFDLFVNEKFKNFDDFNYDELIENWRYAYDKAFIGNDSDDKKLINTLRVIGSYIASKYENSVWDVEIQKLNITKLEDEQKVLTLEEIKNDKNAEAAEFCPFYCD